MSEAFKLPAMWRVVLHDLGVSPGNVLERAALPRDLFAHAQPSLSARQYFDLWDALAAELDDPDVGLRIGQMATAESFDPPLLAALSSPDFNRAAERLATYKLLIGPLTLEVERGVDDTRLTLGVLGVPQMPHAFALAELVFMTHFVRMATRVRVTPREVMLLERPARTSALVEFFGVAPTRGDRNAIRFAAHDAQRPFLTADAGMWRFFEPLLDQRLAELRKEATTADRVHAALVELLPSGRANIAEVAKVLGTSTRSLQRGLADEGTSFQAVLGRTRESLARHYLTRTELPSAEVSYLLGYENPNSFIRAFHRWTGTTPEALRAS